MNGIAKCTYQMSWVDRPTSHFGEDEGTKLPSFSFRLLILAGGKVRNEVLKSTYDCANCDADVKVTCSSGFWLEIEMTVFLADRYIKT